MSFLQRLIGGERRSASAAKERLRAALVHDRAAISPGRMKDMRDDVIDVISRYVEIDHSGVQLSLTNDRRSQRLVAEIPLAESRRRRR